jgi:hypothetical protein
MKVSVPIIVSLRSPDLPEDGLPADPDDRYVTVEAEIGASGEPASDISSFQVVTPRYLARDIVPVWGRGLLIVEQFSDFPPATPRYRPQ